jgi:hypothetical protein
MPGTQYSTRWPPDYLRRPTVQQCQRMKAEEAIAAGWKAVEKPVLQGRARFKYVACPGCGRACKTLLSKPLRRDRFSPPHGYSDFGCRFCLGIAYNSQQAGARRRRIYGKPPSLYPPKPRRFKRIYRKTSDYWNQFAKPGLRKTGPRASVSKSGALCVGSG